MRRVALSTLGYALFGAAVAAVLLLAGSDRTEAVVGGFLVYVAALLAIAALRITGSAFPPPRGVLPASVRIRDRGMARPESLRLIEDSVALAGTDPFEVHFRIHPLLRDAARSGLATSRGIDLDREPERARRALSAETWSLVRHDRPRPERGDASPGLEAASLAAIVDELERMLPS